MYSYASAGLLALISLTPLAPVPLPRDHAKTALEALQGEWRYSDPEADTRERQETSEVQARVIIKGARATFLVRGDGHAEVKFAEATLKLTPGRGPKEIDLTLEQTIPGCCGAKELPRGTTMMGTYSLEGDTLKVYLGEDKERPKKFPPAGEERGLQVLKRPKARK